jgi:hypothetical protein
VNRNSGHVISSSGEPSTHSDRQSTIAAPHTDATAKAATIDVSATVNAGMCEVKFSRY